MTDTNTETTETTERQRDENGRTPQQAARHNVRDAVRRASRALGQIETALAGRPGLSVEGIQERYTQAEEALAVAFEEVDAAQAALQTLVSEFPSGD